MSERYEVFQESRRLFTRKPRWWYRLVGSNNRILFRSSESFRSQRDAVRAAEQAQRVSAEAEIIVGTSS